MYIYVSLYVSVHMYIVYIQIIIFLKTAVAKPTRHAATQPQLLPTESVPESSTQPQGDEIKPRTE